MDNFFFAFADLVVWDKSSFDIDCFFVGLGKVSDMSNRRTHGICAIEVFLDSLCFGWGLYDEELHIYNRAVVPREDIFGK